MRIDVLVIGSGLSGLATAHARGRLRPALETISYRFAKESGRRLEVSYGSSGNLTRQIMGGAPFQLFLSADEEYVGRLERAKLVAESTVYATGELVLVVAADSGVKPDMGQLETSDEL